MKQKPYALTLYRLGPDYEPGEDAGYTLTHVPFPSVEVRKLSEARELVREIDRRDDLDYWGATLEGGEKSTGFEWYAGNGKWKWEQY